MTRPEQSKASREIARGAARTEHTRKVPSQSPLRGLALFGMVGWTVALPTIGGAFVGLWLDRTWPVSFSWTLTLLIAGAVLGAVIAWRWVGRER